MDIVRPASKQPIPPDAKKVFEGVLFDAYQWEQQMFDGSTATFERLKRPDTVVVFPVLPDGTIEIIWQEQPGRPPYISTYGGRVEPGESPDAAALRELREEAGLVADRLVLWDAQQPVAKLDWAVFTFIAHGAMRASTQSLDAGEKIEPRIVSLDQLIDLIASGECTTETERHFIEAKWNPAKREELRTLFAA